MPHSIHILRPGDEAVLSRVAPEVFDGPVLPEFVAEFLGDPRHHIAVAVIDGVVVGMATACDYVHPDKPRALWINEVGVATGYRRRGIARELMQALFAVGRDRGCTEAWVATEPDNVAARALYAATGACRSEAPCVFYEYNLRTDK